MVGERVILFGVEDLEQGAGRVAAEIAPELVYFVEQNHRIPGAGAPDFIDEAAGHGPDVGPAVTADVRLVPHPAQTDPDKRPPERVGNRLAQAGLAHTGRTE